MRSKQVFNPLFAKMAVISGTELPLPQWDVSAPWWDSDGLQGAWSIGDFGVWCGGGLSKGFGWLKPEWRRRFRNLVQQRRSRDEGCMRSKGRRKQDFCRVGECLLKKGSYNGGVSKKSKWEEFEDGQERSSSLLQARLFQNAVGKNIFFAPFMISGERSRAVLKFVWQELHSREETI